MKSLSPTVQKLNIKASFIPILVFAAKRNALNKSQNLFKCTLIYLEGLFLYSPITYIIESSHDQTPDPNQEKSINRL